MPKFNSAKPQLLLHQSNTLDYYSFLNIFNLKMSVYITKMISN